MKDLDFRTDLKKKNPPKFRKDAILVKYSPKENSLLLYYYSSPSYFSSYTITFPQWHFYFIRNWDVNADKTINQTYIKIDEQNDIFRASIKSKP